MKNPPPLLGGPQWSSREREGEVKGPPGGARGGLWGDWPWLRRRAWDFTDRPPACPPEHRLGLCGGRRGPGPAGRDCWTECPCCARSSPGCPGGRVLQGLWPWHSETSHPSGSFHSLVSHSGFSVLPPPESGIGHLQGLQLLLSLLGDLASRVLPGTQSRARLAHAPVFPQGRRKGPLLARVVFRHLPRPPCSVLGSARSGSRVPSLPPLQAAGLPCRWTEASECLLSAILRPIPAAELGCQAGCQAQGPPRERLAQLPWSVATWLHATEADIF